MPNTPNGEVFEFNEQLGRISFLTKRSHLAGDALQEDYFPQCWIDQGIVHPHFAKRFAALFYQTADCSGEETMLRTETGEYQWFCIRTRHLGSGRQKQNTLLIFLDAADRERVLWLENRRICDFYHASLSETIAYAEIDLESDQLRCTGGLWSDYKEEYLPMQGGLIQFMRQRALDQIQNGMELESFSDAESWRALFSAGDPIQRFRYQRRINGDWKWVELVAHSFWEQLAENKYALLYLEDIDAQVRKEQAQLEAANSRERAVTATTIDFKWSECGGDFLIIRFFSSQGG